MYTYKYIPSYSILFESDYTNEHILNFMFNYEFFVVLQVLFGERIRPSPYNVSTLNLFDYPHLTCLTNGTNLLAINQIVFLQNKTCEKVCTKTYDPKKNPKDRTKLSMLKRGIVKNYQNHWLMIIINSINISIFNYQYIV